METTKRSMDPDPSGETFAVCNKCSRLSFNLKTCDKCGCQLGEDSSSHCYSSDPKRPRTDDGPSANGSDSATALADKLPDSNVRPQALFVNMNNQAFPVINAELGLNVSRSQSTGVSVPSTHSTVVLSTASSVMPTADRNANSVNRPRPNILTNGRQPVPVAISYNGMTPSSVPAILSQRAPVVNSVAVPSVAQRTSSQLTGGLVGGSQISLPSYNLQPPPPPFSSNIARLPVVVSSGASIPAMISSPAASQSTQQVQAIEIRIGSKKFKPISPVTFKDEGVLFMLKDFTYAPVLLNTRAIIKCRANLSTFSYPAMFLYLENSCMRQIRSIFGLGANEFASNSPVELRRCISIFPVFGSEGKSQVQNISYSVKRTFEAMVRRYPRSTAILEEITNEQVIDILIDSSESSSVVNGNGDSSNLPSALDGEVSADGATSTGGVTNLHTSSSLASSQSSSNSLANNNRLVASQLQAASMSLSLSSSIATVTTAVPASGGLGAPSGTSPQVLVIPQDATRWQALQRSLVAGGVYHVMVHTGQRKYCLWNGSQLVPCMVQNTEVQLSCSRVRLGTLHAQCVGQVRIRAEPGSGIYFTLKSDTTGQQEISITPDDILSCEICFSKTTTMFINTSWSATEKLRTKLGMQTGREPSFDASGTDMRRKYIILFLTDVNRDQEDALTQMKFPRTPNTQKAFDVMDFNSGICRLVQIKMDMKVATSVHEYLNAHQLMGSDGFERLAREVADAGSSSYGPVVDDDDDDVIMTQEEVGIKCPYTQQVMKEPVRNKVCGHNYEKMAIMEFIVRKKGNAKCPYAGCGQTVSLRVEDLVDNLQLKEYIAKTVNKASTT